MFRLARELGFVLVCYPRKEASDSWLAMDGYYGNGNGIRYRGADLPVETDKFCSEVAKQGQAVLALAYPLQKPSPTCTPYWPRPQSKRHSSKEA